MLTLSGKLPELTRARGHHEERWKSIAMSMTYTELSRGTECAPTILVSRSALAKRGVNQAPSGWLALSNIRLVSQQSNLKGLGVSIGLSDYEGR